MHPKQAVALGVRLFVIWMVFDILEFVPSIFKYFLANWSEKDLANNPLYTALGMGAVVIIALVCVGLWKFPLALAKSILPASETVSKKPNVPEEWFLVGCSLLALYFLGNAIPRFAGNLFVWIRKLDVAGVDQIFFSYLMKDVFQIIIALVLLFGKNGILKLIRYTHTPEK